MKKLLLIGLLLLTSCSYNKVYFKTMNEVTEAFPEHNTSSDIKVRRVSESYSEYFNYYEVKYKPFN